MVLNIQNLTAFLYRGIAPSHESAERDVVTAVLFEAHRYCIKTAKH